MKRKKLNIIGVIIAISIAAIITLTMILDGVVKSNIETTASDLLKTEVRVSNVDLSILTGSGNIYGFVVQNPKNFSDQPAIIFDKVYIELNLWSLFTDQIRIKEMTIESPNLLFEQRGFGANLKTLVDNMNTEDGEPSETQLIIQHLLIDNSTVQVSTSIDRERSVKTEIGKLELHDVGKQSSYTARETTREILRPLLEKAMAEALRSGVTEQLQSKVKDLLGS